MGALPRVTVLIPTFNRSDYLAACLDSILGQTLAPVQVVVVDDGSSDRTPEVLRPYLKRIDYVETPQLGKPEALNRGLAKVEGDYVWIFDDDDVALPEAIERFVRPLERHPQHGFSYSTFYFTASSDGDAGLGAVLDEMRIPDDLDERGFLVALLEWNFLGGAAIFARTACYERVGGFDPGLLRSQDYEMAIRIARCFSGIRVAGSPTFHYRQHDGLRGPLSDRFRARYRFAKWLEYDREFFERLYYELPLDDYLPPRHREPGGRRQALLQRIAVMASRGLHEQVAEDLHVIASLEDDSPLNDRERTIIRALILDRHYYGQRSTADSGAFFEQVNALSGRGVTMRRLRQEVLGSLWQRLERSLRSGRLPTLLRDAAHLCRLYVRRPRSSDE